jgi:hypothetical protein
MPETASNEAHSDKPAWGTIYRFQTAMELSYLPIHELSSNIPYREAVCGLCEKIVSLALDIPIGCMQAATRSNADAALARQIAMYLCHTTFSLLLTEIGFHFRRDRTTVSYACAVVEDKRDDMAFDIMITELEVLLDEARNAISICLEEGLRGQDLSSEQCCAVDEGPCSTQLLSDERRLP